MGIVKTNITLSNPRYPNLESIIVESLVDTGALHLCITEAQCIQLKLEEGEKRPVTLADGKVYSIPYVGPIKVDWHGRISYTGAMVLGKQCLLGAIPMEDMDILVHPAKQTVIANPLHPNIPASVAYVLG
ncbi:MAG: clan AA aspartic protease [Sphingobacteriales bacterium]|nr:MAG: clan AA aspartic protease [Sphingobacteriales bacterium]TAF81242.1 MAG: clan AA aspartic protease [Sphingobacteriales bacterium]